MKLEAWHITIAPNNVLLCSTSKVLLHAQMKTLLYFFWVLKSGTLLPPVLVGYYSHALYPNRRDANVSQQGQK